MQDCRSITRESDCRDWRASVPQIPKGDTLVQVDTRQLDDGKWEHVYRMEKLFSRADVALPPVD
jgi:hypothetical protein